MIAGFSIDSSLLLGCWRLWNELEVHLVRGRAAVTIPGAEPVFINKGNFAFLMLHGWCATAESVRFLTAGMLLGIPIQKTCKNRYFYALTKFNS